MIGFLKPKPIIWVMIGCAVVTLAIILPKNKKPSDNDLQTKGTEQHQSNIEINTLDDLYADMRKSISDTDVNSSDRVDAIARYAKKAAKKGNGDIGDEAVIFIVENYPNYYDSNATMEKTMLCGYYLEYLDYADRVTKLGQDVTQAIKYVYRGVESVDDEATQINLDQIWEIIETSNLH